MVLILIKVSFKVKLSSSYLNWDCLLNNNKSIQNIWSKKSLLYVQTNYLILKYIEQDYNNV